VLFVFTGSGLVILFIVKVFRSGHKSHCPSSLCDPAMNSKRLRFVSATPLFHALTTAWQLPCCPLGHSGA
jgi:hypothetical protein